MLTSPVTSWFIDLFGPWALMVALLWGGVGAFLWLFGGRFSRAIFTLLGVGAGTMVGLEVPAWMGWPVDGIAMAFTGAFAGGLAGWLLHTTWVGMTLSVLLAGLFGACAWAWYDGGWDWRLPPLDASQPHSVILGMIWQSLPGDMLPRVMPYAIAAGLISGVAVKLAWPRLARACTFSLVGVGLMTICALTAVQIARPQWFQSLPDDVATLTGLLAVMALFGLAVQSWMMPAASISGPSRAGNKATTPSAVAGPALPSSPSSFNPALGPTRPVMTPTLSAALPGVKA